MPKLGLRARICSVLAPGLGLLVLLSGLGLWLLLLRCAQLATCGAQIQL
jgi:hypothetical protein